MRSRQARLTSIDLLPVLGVGALALAVLLLCGFAYTRVHQSDAAAPPRGLPAVPVASADSGPIIPIPKDPKVLIVGDSFTEGYGAAQPTDGFAYKLGPLMGWKRTVIDGVGGTGFVAATAASNGQPFAERVRLRVQQHPNYKPDLVIFESGLNDVNKPYDELSLAVQYTLTVARNAWPNAELVVLGPIDYRDYSQVGAAFDAGVAALGGGGTYMVPFDTTQTWLPNSNALYFRDHFHPSTAGHERIAERLAAELKYDSTHNPVGKRVSS